MAGVFSRGAREQALSISISAAPQLSMPLACFILILPFGGELVARRRTGEADEDPITDSIGRILNDASLGETPEASSTTAPKSRAIDTGFITTRLPASTVATESPLASKINALEGTLSTCAAAANCR